MSTEQNISKIILKDYYYISAYLSCCLIHFAHLNCILTMPTPTLMKVLFNLTTTWCVIFNSEPKYNQSYSDCLCVYVLNRIPVNTCINVFSIPAPTVTPLCRTFFKQCLNIKEGRNTFFSFRFSIYQFNQDYVVLQINSIMTYAREAQKNYVVSKLFDIFSIFLNAIQIGIK